MLYTRTFQIVDSNDHVYIRQFKGPAGLEYPQELLDWLKRMGLEDADINEDVTAGIWDE